MHAWTLNGSVNRREICHWHDNINVINIFKKKGIDLTVIVVSDVHWEKV